MIKEIKFPKNLSKGDTCSETVSQLNRFHNENQCSLRRLVCKTLHKDAFFLATGYGSEEIDLLKLVSIFSGNLYFSKRMNNYIYESKISPFSDINELPEFLDYGFYHTDFSTAEWDVIPKYVAIQCIQTDPKYPHYGMNHYSNVKEIFNRLETIHPGITEHCLNMEIPFRFSCGTVKRIKFLHQDNSNNISIRLHLFFVAEDLFSEYHYVDGKPINRLINAMATEISKDVVLNKGDIMILSNKTFLHKRGECSIKFSDSFDSYESRATRTIRFY